MKFELCIPTLFGLEGIVADELKFEGGIKGVRADNGRVFFEGDEDTLIWANLWCRCGERVLIKLAEFEALTFEDLFQGVARIRWEDYIPKDGNFQVKGHSLNSQLHSVPSCQSVAERAVVKRLGLKYGIERFEKDGSRYQIQFSIMKDRVMVFLDSTGVGLHKRAYRIETNEAPIRETLAAALVKLARYRGGQDFLDPFCGSGTIPIEAAMISMNRAPGMMRKFDAEKWHFISQEKWIEARKNAIASVKKEEFPIFASDIDSRNRDLSIDNARRAGVLKTIRFDVADARLIDYSKKTGTLIANPPYGERLFEKEECEALYRDFGRAIGKSEIKQFIITSHDQFEECYGRRSDKRRKLYNGMIKCNAYMYFKK
ncbi:MAG: class I SAM-dependent RNA methyltransferase [Clostridia bacterium]